MDESFHVDAADMEDGTYYRDDKCKRLKENLGRDSRFEGYVVKRLRTKRHFSELRDPFDIQNSDGEHVVWFYIWEFDILNESEILSYLDVQRKREQRLDSYMNIAVIAFVICFIGAIVVGADVLLILLDMSAGFARSMFPVALLVLISGLLLLYASLKRKWNAETRWDIEAAREDSAFLMALRKLAALSENRDKHMVEYARRYGKVERGLVT